MKEDEELQSNVLLPDVVSDQESQPGNNISSDPRLEKESFLRRLRRDEIFKQKILLWVFLCLSSTILGWGMGQLGPSLLDLKEITSSSLDEASFFLTSVYVGYLVGTIVCGAIYQRMNPFLLLFLGIVCLGITSASIPWSVYYWLMITMHVIKGFGFGIMDTAGNSVFMVSFHDEKKIQSYLNVIHLSFAIGGFLSPIATAPFLMQQGSGTGDMTNTPNICMVSSLYRACDVINSSQTENSIDNLTKARLCFVKGGRNLSLHDNNTTRNRNNFTQASAATNITDINIDQTTGKLHENNSTQGRFSNQNLSKSTAGKHTKYNSFGPTMGVTDKNNSSEETEPITKNKSILYKAYFITAGFCGVFSLPFLWMYIRDHHNTKTDMPKNYCKHQLPKHVKCAILIIMCLFLGVDNGLEDTFFGMFNAFVVLQLGWTKEEASYAISVYWASFAMGRLSSVFLGAKFDFRILLGVYLNLFLVSSIGFFVSAMFQMSIGIWIFYPVMGFAISIFFPYIFLWVKDFMTVAGKVSACLLVCASLGSMINPILIGFLMENFGVTWFAYVTFADVIVLWLLYWLVKYISIRIKQLK